MSARSLPHQSRANLYLAVFAALGVLTGLTVGVAYLHLSHTAAIAVAALIAAIKVSLICAVFMHMKSEGGIIRGFFFTAVIGVILLLALTLPDFLRR